MEKWLQRVIFGLPEAWKKQVERQIREGAFISFAGSEGREEGRLGDARNSAAMTALIGELLAADSAWEGTACAPSPEGEPLVRISLPLGLPAEALLKATLLKGAAFAFAPPRGQADEEGSEAILLDCSSLDEMRIREGLRRIGEALAEFSARLEG